MEKRFLIGKFYEIDRTGKGVRLEIPTKFDDKGVRFTAWLPITFYNIENGATYVYPRFLMNLYDRLTKNNVTITIEKPEDLYIKIDEYVSRLNEKTIEQ